MHALFPDPMRRGNVKRFLRVDARLYSSLVGSLLAHHVPLLANGLALLAMTDASSWAPWSRASSMLGRDAGAPGTGPGLDDPLHRTLPQAQELIFSQSEFLKKSLGEHIIFDKICFNQKRAHMIDKSLKDIHPERMSVKISDEIVPVGDATSSTGKVFTYM